MTQHFVIADELRQLGTPSFYSYVRLFGALNKSLRAIATEWAEYSEKAFEDSTETFEQIVGAKSVEHAIGIQSAYVERAYEAHIAEMMKLSEMYASLVHNAFKSQSG